MNSGRAGCGESRTSGSAGRPGKRTGPQHHHCAPARLNVVLIAGARRDAEALWDEVGSVLAPMGLRLLEEKTRVCHIDEGFDFLGWRIQRRTQRGRGGKRAVYGRLNPVLRGWCNYFLHGVSQRTFS